MALWPNGKHIRLMRELVRQLDEHAPGHHEAGDEALFFEFPAWKVALAPDVHVSDSRLLRAGDSPPPGRALSLAADLDPNRSPPGPDPTWQVDVYGRSGVEVYLALDLIDRRMSVYSGPSKHGYRSRATEDLSGRVRIPAPFDFDLDTSAFAHCDR
ncbi:hypothetical protein GCM10027447_38540 [Glycomyces halotolerans]